MKEDSTPHFIQGSWVAGSGRDFTSTEPASGDSLWTGSSAGTAEVEAAVTAAHEAFPDWSSSPLERREAVLDKFISALDECGENLAKSISEEIGKPRWEALTEINAMKAKVRFSLQAYQERRSEQTTPSGPRTSATRFKPHGVAAVLGPFNLPGHLPNAHLVPALLAGNTVIFKPSELAPLTGRLLGELWQQAGLPPGVFNLIQGERDTGKQLVQHQGLDAVFFTGGVVGGRAIARSLADSPQVILALELGGNNPLVVWEPADIPAAVYHTMVSAFITSGQRCTCARRLILPEGDFASRLLDQLTALAGNLRVGLPSENPEPFLGPVISCSAADQILASRDNLLKKGAVECLRMKRQGDALLTPGILDVTGVADCPDEEVFGPLLQVIRVDTLDEAIQEANRTRFGLSSGLICEESKTWKHFYHQARAGIINWNQPLTGASGAQPFGGIGWSGNHRPSGYYAADYCSYPIASTECAALTLPDTFPPGVEFKPS